MHAIDITILQMRGQKMDYAHCPLRKVEFILFPLVPEFLNKFSFCRDI